MFTFFITIFFPIIYGVSSESLCSQMGGNCNSYYDVCRTGKYSYENHLCTRYGQPPVCCFYDYWDNDCIRRGGSCFDMRFSSCTNGRLVNDGCGGDYKYCCIPIKYYPPYNQRSYYNQQYYNSHSKSYPYNRVQSYLGYSSSNQNTRNRLQSARNSLYQNMLSAPYRG